MKKNHYPLLTTYLASSVLSLLLVLSPSIDWLVLAAEINDGKKSFLYLLIELFNFSNGYESIIYGLKLLLTTLFIFYFSFAFPRINQKWFQSILFICILVLYAFFILQSSVLMYANLCSLILAAIGSYSSRRATSVCLTVCSLLLNLWIGLLAIISISLLTQYGNHGIVYRPRVILIALDSILISLIIYAVHYLFLQA